jgi:RimJ/RimL family protein N-acetyltransferase
MNILFETERLQLRQFNLEDTAFIIELLNSPGWLKFIGDRNVKTMEDAKNYLVNGPMKSYGENGYGLSMVETKTGNVPVGMCGILKRGNLEFPDIGFAFLPAYHGLGYAQEIATETMHYAMNELKIQKVAAITVPDNKRSIRLLEKIGLHFDRLITLPGSSQELMLFSTK